MSDVHVCPQCGGEGEVRVCANWDPHEIAVYQCAHCKGSGFGILEGASVFHPPGKPTKQTTLNPFALLAIKRYWTVVED